MRSYGQYCALAKALDVVGDRWTLLIVRELMTQGPSRYTDLRNGLPGIATNLLAQRLRGLEQAGLVESEEAPPPVAATLFRLTPRGQELESVLLEIGRWGAPLMATQGRGDHFCSHWMTLAARRWLRDNAPHAPPVTIEVRTGDEPLVIEARAGTIDARPGTAATPDVVMEGSPRLIMGVLTGRLDLDAARAAGLRYDGDPAVLRRVQPQGLKELVGS